MNNNNQDSFSKANIFDFEHFCEDTMDEWYDAKHRKPSDSELALVNGLPVKCCPHCGHDRFKRSGYYRNGTRRYRCLGCGRAFSPLTGTLFDSHKIPISEWLEYLIHLFEFHSVMSSARDNRNVKNTGKYWIYKVFAVLSDCQKDVVLSGRIHLDETYFSVKPKEEERKDGKLYRGLSRNKICVATATDGRHVYLTVCGRAKPSKTRLLKSFSGHIMKGSTIVHDGEKSHSALIGAFKLKEELHKSEETKGMEDKENPMEPINAVHRALKRFMRSHPSYDRDTLQDWLNLFWFIAANKDKKPYEKAKKFIRMAILTHKVIRYREIFPENSGK